MSRASFAGAVRRGRRSLSSLLKARRSCDRRRFVQRLFTTEALEQRLAMTATPVSLTGDFLEVPHTADMQLANGTITLDFVADSVSGRRTLFSKDARGYGAGGHLSAFVVDGRLEVRLQNLTETFTLQSEYGSVLPGEDYHLAITFGAGGFQLFLDGEAVATRTDVRLGLENNLENLVIGANTWSRDTRNPTWTSDYFDGTIDDFTIYGRALNRFEIAYLAPADPAEPSQGTTGTGLDRLVDIILQDPGLRRSIPATEIAAGAEAANLMNGLIIAAIQATGVANDGTFSSGDIRDINAWLRSSDIRRAQWIVWHGDDEGSVETGFHLVQNDGAKTYLFGDENAVNTVADGIYHLGFQICDGRLLNEDDNANASLQDVAYWLNELLTTELASGQLANPAVDWSVRPTTQTGLDGIVELILADPGLARNVSTSDLVGGARAAAAMNALLVTAIRDTGVANDHSLSVGDVRDINAYLRATPEQRAKWIELHGDDEDRLETGFHLVQNDGATTYLFGDDNAVNTVADGLYHLGFAIRDGRLLNEDGNSNASLADVAYWLNELLAEDLRGDELVNPAVNLTVAGTTQTGLDQLISIITTDTGLARNVATTELVAGARAANEMNTLIVGAIRATGVANDGVLSVADLREVNAYLRTPPDQIIHWMVLHGDDEGDVESGFHLLQNDGAKTYLFGDDNAVNTVADGIYHLGFAIKGNRLLNEDGDTNASLQDVAFWLNELLAQDLAAGRLTNPALAPNPANIEASEVLTQASVTVDAGAGAVELPHTSALQLANGTITLDFVADSVSGRRTLFSKDARGYGAGGHLSAFVVDGRLEVRLQNLTETFTLQSEYGSVLPGEDYHLAITFGAGGFQLFLDGEAVATRTDVRLGLENNLENLVIGANTWSRDTRNPTWTSDYFDGTIDDFTIYGRALNRFEIAYLAPADPAEPSQGTTGTGLDRLVDIILQDPGLRRSIPATEIAAGAEAANLMNGLIIAAIQATGVANDGTFSSGDIRDINAWLRSSDIRRAQWIVWHGDDEGSVETGFHLVQNDGAKTYLFGDENAVNTVADGIYHLGFQICDGRLLNEDDNANASLQDVAYWLNELLTTELASGQLANPAVDWSVRPTTQTGLDGIVELILADPGLARNVSTSDLVGGARAAAAMNALLVTAIRDTGVANDHSLSVGDVRDINAYLRATPEQRAKWIELHGDDEDRLETGFHLVQNDGATTYLFGDDNAVNTVADGLYHLGFAIRDGRLLNEDGNSNASLADVAYWLNELLAEDLRGDELVNPAVNLTVAGTTQTGLDQLISIITTDTGLARNVATTELVAGARAANEMNTLIVGAIRATGVANDGVLSVADLREVNAYLRTPPDQIIHWMVLHGDDEGDVESGFHLLQNDGAKTYLFGDDNAVNTVADGIYHLGFAIKGNRLLNEDGDTNASLQDVAFWLNELLAQDLAAGRLTNPALAPNPANIEAAVVRAIADPLGAQESAAAVDAVLARLGT
ncbi:MAG: LamG domain-containing protein [Pirellulaceae bacterium]